MDITTWSVIDGTWRAVDLDAAISTIYYGETESEARDEAIRLTPVAAEAVLAPANAGDGDTHRAAEHNG